MPIRTDLWKVSATPQPLPEAQLASEKKLEDIRGGKGARRERGQGRILQTKVLPRPDSRLGGFYAAANSNR
jgi:hypothetical protein